MQHHYVERYALGIVLTTLFFALLGVSATAFAQTSAADVETRFVGCYGYNSRPRGTVTNTKYASRTSVPTEVATTVACVNYCYKLNKKYATRNGSLCGCSDAEPAGTNYATGRYADLFCNGKCSGDANQTCGGGYSVYRVYRAKAETAAAAPTNPPPTTPAPSTTGTTSGYLGCYLTRTGGWSPWVSNLNPQRCIDKCKTISSMKYAALTGHRCYCLSTMPTTKLAETHSSCTALCTYDRSHKCGTFNQAYRTYSLTGTGSSGSTGGTAPAPRPRPQPTVTWPKEHIGCYTSLPNVVICASNITSAQACLDKVKSMYRSGRYTYALYSASYKHCYCGRVAPSSGSKITDNTCSSRGRYAVFKIEATTCKAGEYVAGAGKCVKCPAGQHSSSGGWSSCRKCPKGWYAAAAGSVNCSRCPAGQYSTSEASTSCTKCAAGTYSTNPTSSSCTTCPAGTYSAAGSGSCTPCAAGTYSDTAGATSCKRCSSGQTSTTGATMCANGTNCVLITKNGGCLPTYFHLRGTASKRMYISSVTYKETFRYGSRTYTTHRTCMGGSSSPLKFKAIKTTLAGQTVVRLEGPGGNTHFQSVGTYCPYMRHGYASIASCCADKFKPHYQGGNLWKFERCSYRGCENVFIMARDGQSAYNTKVSIGYPYNSGSPHYQERQTVLEVIPQ